MNIIEREFDGSKKRYHTDDVVSLKLSRIDYSYSDFNVANEVNRGYLPADVDPLFQLNPQFIDKINADHLFPAYYIMTLNENATGPGFVDMVRMSENPFNPDDLVKYLDLQLMNNLMFMLVNSSEFNIQKRNLLKKGIEAYLVLSAENNDLLRKILMRRYNYDLPHIERYCAQLENYIFSLVVNKVKSVMKYDTSYLAFYYYRYAIQSKLTRYVTSEMMGNMTNFLLDCMERKLNEFKEFSDCKDIFDEDYFGREILDLSGLDFVRTKKLMDDIADYYVGHSSREFENANYSLAYKYYKMLEDSKYHFDTERLQELENLKLQILEKYNPDIILDKAQRQHNQEHNYKVLIPLLIAILLIQTVAGAMYLWGKVNIMGPVFIGCGILFILILVVDKRREKRLYGNHPED